MARKSVNFSGNITPLFASMLVQNQAPEGEGSAIHPEPQPTPSTSQPNVSEPQIASLHIETSPTVAPQTKAHQTTVSQIIFHEAHIEQILPSLTTYQRKRKTQKHRRTKKDTELPQTSVPLDHGADEAVHKEGVTDAQAVEILNLKKRVKKLERKRKLSISHPRRRKYRQVKTSSDDDFDEEDASKQGRRSDKLKLMFKDKDFEELDDHMENVEEETVDAATTRVSTASAPVSTVGKAKEKGVAIIDVEGSSRIVRPIRSITTFQPLPNINPKDKGKGVLIKEEPKKIKRRGQGLAQIESDVELAQRIYEEDLVELERAQQERQRQEDDTNAALAKEFDEIQARIDVDHELAVRLTHEEQEKYTIKERARLLAKFFDPRKKQLETARAEAIRNKPPIKTQRLYEKEKRWIDDFQPMDTEAIKDSEKKVDNSSNPAGGSRKKTHARKRTGEKKSEESAKKQKLEDVTEEQESTKSDKEAAVDYEHEKEELRMWLIVVLYEEETVDLNILSAKYHIVDWESQNLGSVNMEDLYVYKIIRADGNISYHKSLSSVLRKFDR
ncbi:hypothetical protein Tco_0754415 [Tanacetum coccineum]